MARSSQICGHVELPGMAVYEGSGHLNGTLFRLKRRVRDDFSSVLMKGAWHDGKT